MKSSRQLGILLVTALAVIGLVFMSNLLPESERRDLAGAEFLVS